MSKDDICLPVEMEKLEIEPNRITTNEENPFTIRTAKLKNWKLNQCSCLGVKRKTSNNVKRYSCKLLKEPVLNYINECCQRSSDEKSHLVTLSKNSHRNITNPVKTKIDLSKVSEDGIVNNNDISRDFNSLSFSENFGEIIVQERNRPSGPSCSQQALNPQCDVTMDELASYFETLVHIPKKMSEMAEMMYT